MEVTQGARNFRSIKLSPVLWKSSLSLYMEEKLSSIDEIHDEIEFSGILKRTVQSNQKGMLVIEENITLAHHLLSLFLRKILLYHHLKQIYSSFLLIVCLC